MDAVPKEVEIGTEAGRPRGSPPADSSPTTLAACTRGRGEQRVSSVPLTEDAILYALSRHKTCYEPRSARNVFVGSLCQGTADSTVTKAPLPTNFRLVALLIATTLDFTACKIPGSTSLLN